MGYASKLGRARISANRPEAAGVCDRCGCVVSFRDLIWQMDWRGAALMNIRLLVCRHCLDVPQEQLRAITLSADPEPIINARPQDYVDAEAGPAGAPAYGQPVGLQPGAVTPLAPGAGAYGQPLSVLSITANGTNTVTVTCSVPHGLATNSQVSVEGLTNRSATGFYSVNVTTATAFNYLTYAVIPPSSLLTPTTRMITALVGLPYGVTVIPQIGP